MQIFTILAVVLGLAASKASADMLSMAGIENCPNKCDKVFDRTQYAITDQPGADSFEYRSCIIGCNQCATQLEKGPQTPESDNCFSYCKTYNYAKNGIRKGVIEPDKACIMGCLINTCQKVCIGGTTDQNVTPNNQQYWWGLGGPGCSIKTGLGYVQNPDYGNPNSPSGPGATTAQKQCCTNAFNLCYYNGPTTTTNYANVVLVAQRTCKNYVKSTNVDAICSYYNDPQQCGTQGMVPV